MREQSFTTTNVKDSFLQENASILCLYEIICAFCGSFASINRRVFCEETTNNV